jgi:membrane-associated phospholipid phosphatase
MSSEVEISYLSTNIITLFLVFFAYDVIGCSQNLQSLDSSNLKLELLYTTNRNNVSSQKPTASFYKTDSIFSFQSPKGYVPSLLSNFGEQITAPLRFNKKDWIITGAAVGMTIALIHFDNDIDKWATVQKQKHVWVNKSSPVITQFGSTYGISSVAVIGLISAAFKNQKGVQTSVLATQAWITSAVWVQLIKHFTGREDPSASYIYSKVPGGKWWGPFAQYDQDVTIYKSVSSFDAFPSGHTAAAFSIATVFATQYNNTAAIPIISYSMATLVGISRLTEHQHWASDVFVGGLIGYACGKQVVAHFNKIHQNPVNSLSSKSNIKTEFTFIQNGNQIGFSLTW